MEFLLAVALLVLGYHVYVQRARIGQIEDHLRRLTQDKGDAAEAPKEMPIESAKTDIKPAQAGPWAKTTAMPVMPKRPAERPPKPTEPAPEKQPSAFVFRQSNLEMLGNWLRDNWFLAVAALSLALAGIFLVQYGVENGLITPFWRVIGAASLGIALIWGGEFVRRRWGDEDDAHTAYLPSTFSGAGLVALFAAVLSARQLYGLIGAEGALFWLVLVSIVGVILGWFYGPFLAAFGVAGSIAAPFLVGGESDTPQIFFYYFALIAITSLFIDAIRRWAWVSVLGLIGAYVAAWMNFASGAGDAHYLAFALIVAFSATTVPMLTLFPRHDGPGLSQGFGWFLKLTKAFPEFPTRAAAGAFLATSVVVILVALKDAGPGELWLVVVSIALMYLAVTIWLRGAPALADLSLVPPALFLFVIAVQSLDFGHLYALFQAGADRVPESAPPNHVTVFAGVALAGSAIAFWRSLVAGKGTPALVWASGAAILAPLTLVELEILWDPETVLGAGRWAGHAIVVAIAMVFFAERSAAQDPDDRRRPAVFALAALTMIGFALILILSSTALTVALAVMIVSAVLIDRQFDLRLLTVFIQIGAIVVTFRLIFWPGIGWAIDAPFWEICLGYLGAIALMGSGWFLTRVGRWPAGRITLESAIWVIAATFASVLLLRMPTGSIESHWGASLLASVWLVSALNQLYRLKIRNAPRIAKAMRVTLAIVFGAVSWIGYSAVFLFLNPMSSSQESVEGPILFDSLALAFVVPAAILAVGYWKLGHIRHWMRVALAIMSAMFATAYVGLEIRRLWRGRDLSVPGTTQPELYTYTIALLVVSVALLFVAFSRRSMVLRRLAVAGIGVTIAKVFLIDMAGLTGLLRVFSFLGLGLSLAGLAWIDRRMSAQWDNARV